MASDEDDGGPQGDLAPLGDFSSGEFVPSGPQVLPADDDDADARPAQRRVPAPPPRHHIGECEEGDGRQGRPDGAPAPFAALQYPLYKRGETQTSLEATLNLLNNLLGAGLLVMPRAFAEAGILSGLVVMGAMAVANKYTLMLVLRMSGSTLEEEPSYPEIGKRILGHQGLVLVLSAYLLFTGGILVGYLIALVDIFSALPAIKGAPRFIHVCLALMICTPGATLKSLRHVAVLSGVCMAGVCVLVFVLTLACVGDVLSSEVITAADVAWIRTEPRGLFAAAALFALQFSVQAGGIEVLTQLPAEQEEEEDEAGDMHDSAGLSVAENISRNSYIVATLISAVIGIAGYTRFGAKVKGDVLLDFDPLQHGGVLTVTRVCYAFVVTSSFAFMMVPCRHAVLDVFALRSRSDGDDSMTADSFKRTTAFILITCGGLAWLVSDLASLFKFVGVWATMALAFVLPCGFFMELKRRQEGTRLFSSANALPLMLVAFGFAVIASSTIDYAFGHHKGHHGHRHHHKHHHRAVVPHPTQAFVPTEWPGLNAGPAASDTERLGYGETVTVETPAVTT